MDAELARELFDYDPKTGIIRWKINISRHKKGDVAGSVMSNGRYLTIRYKYKYYMLHRVAFLIMEGRWPEPEVDHSNLDTFDNRWCNLRESTKSQNAANRNVRVNNKIGLKGVVKVIRYGVAKFEARIRIDGKQMHLGRFSTAQEAHQAYVIAAEKYHKQFARG